MEIYGQITATEEDRAGMKRKMERKCKEARKEYANPYEGKLGAGAA